VRGDSQSTELVLSMWTREQWHHRRRHDVRTCRLLAAFRELRNNATLSYRGASQVVSVTSRTLTNS